MSKVIELRNVNPNVNYWVVRAGKEGVFGQHFEDNNIISIGHLDSMSTALTSQLTDDDKFTELVSRYKASLITAGKIQGSVTVSASQVTKFVKEIQIGDIVISMDKHNFIAGTVTSRPYISDIPIIVRDPVDGSQVGHDLNYSLRRNIQWTKKQNKKSLPYGIQKSLKANQTVFSINEHWKAVNHWLNVIYFKDHSVFFSSRIEQSESINNFDVTQYAVALNQLEAYATLLAQHIDDGCTTALNTEDIEESIKNIYNLMCRERSFSLTTQQTFMSPGDYWGELKGTRTKQILFTALFASLMNINVAFAEEDQHIIQQLKPAIEVGAVIVKNNVQFDFVQEGLKLRVPEPSDKVDIALLDVERMTDNDFPDDEPAGFIAQ